MTRPLLAVALLAASISACGPARPPESPEAAKEAPSADPAASASAAPDTAKPPPAEAPAAEASPSEALARELLKAGGRRIGWSSSKKRFVLPVDFRADGGRGLDLRFYDDQGAQREILRVCQPGECEERLDEIVKEMLPKLAGRLDKEGFEAVTSIGWPSGSDGIQVSALEAKLRWAGGKLTLVGKKTTPLRPLGGRGPKGDLEAVYAVPSAKLLAVLAGELFVFKLPD